MYTAGQASSPRDVLSMLYSMNDEAENITNKSKPAMYAASPNVLESKCGTLVVTSEATEITNCEIDSVISCSSLDTNESVNTSETQRCDIDAIDEIKVDMAKPNLSQKSIKREHSDIEENVGMQANIMHQRELEALNEQVKYQHDELEQYHTMVQKYRTSVREKVGQIRALEIDVSELRNNAGEIVAPQITQAGNTDCKQDHIITESYSSVQEMSNETTSQYQIIESLTNENNALRKREIGHLQEGATMEKEVILLRGKVRDLEEVRDTTIKELELKTGINESILQRLADFESDERKHQVEIANLSQEVFKLQKTVDDGKKERIVFQKLLSTSRETASLAMSKNMTDRENSRETESGDPLSTSDTQSKETKVAASLRKELEATKKREKGMLRQLSQQLGQIGVNTDLGDSEEIELEQQLQNSKCSIMDQLSDSQQQAIVFLSSEVDKLRSLLEVECMEKDDLVLSVENKNQEIKILQKEIELLGSEAVENEGNLKLLEIKLSTQLGKNACLRDEVQELEIKSKRFVEIEIELVKKEKEYRKLDLKLKALAKMNTGDDSAITVNASNDDSFQNRTHIGNSNKSTREVSVLKRALKQTYEKKFERQIQDHCNIVNEKDTEIASLKGHIESKEGLITRQQEQKFERHLQEHSNIVHEKNIEIARLKSCIENKEDSIAQQKGEETYEKTLECQFQEYINSAQEKDVQIAHLKDCIKSKEESITRQQEQLNKQIIQRITFEAEYEQEHENLSNSLNERDRELKYMRKRIIKLKKSGASLAWNAVSKTGSRTEVHEEENY